MRNYLLNVCDRRLGDCYFGGYYFVDYWHGPSHLNDSLVPHHYGPDYQVYRLGVLVCLHRYYLLYHMGDLVGLHR